MEYFKASYLKINTHNKKIVDRTLNLVLAWGSRFLQEVM